MSPLRIIGPACMAVCISSPVRSRKPVLMKATRAAAAAMQAFRLTLVRRSSSMMPSLTVLAGRPSSCFDAAEQLAGEGHFGRAVHLRLDDVDRAGARVADAVAGPCASGRAARWSVVTTASRMPSGISLPPSYRIAGLVIRWPTLRTNSSERPCSVTSPPPSAPVYSRSGFRPRVKVLPPLVDLLGQRALQDAQPVAVGQHLVVGIDHGHRVFQVEDGRQRRFEHHVADAGGIGLADGGAAVDADVEVQAVVLQQHRRRRRRVALVADELRRLAAGRWSCRPSSSRRSLPPSTR